MWKTVGVITVLIILSIYDIKIRAVPTRILIAIGCFSVLYAVNGLLTESCSILECSMALIPGMLFLIVGKLTLKIGYGDGFLLIILGLLFDSREMMAVFIISLFLTCVFSGILLVCGKVRKNTRIPYIPFITIAIMVVRYEIINK